MDKRTAWTRIRSNYPDLAKFLMDFNRLFGKPGSLRVTDTKTGTVIFSTSTAD